LDWHVWGLGGAIDAAGSHASAIGDVPDSGGVHCPRGLHNFVPAASPVNRVHRVLVHSAHVAFVGLEMAGQVRVEWLRVPRPVGAFCHGWRRAWVRR